MRKLLPLFILLFSGCQPTPPNPVVPSPDADASTPVVVDAISLDASPEAAVDSASDTPPNNDLCAAAQANLIKLGCKDSRGRLIGGPNLHGIAWADVCRSNKANQVDMNPACIAIKTSCPEVEQCH